MSSFQGENFLRQKALFLEIFKPLPYEASTNVLLETPRPNYDATSTCISIFNSKLLFVFHWFFLSKIYNVLILSVINKLGQITD